MELPWRGGWVIPFGFSLFSRRLLCVAGCGGFASAFVESLEIYGSTPDAVLGRITMIVDNPSVVTMDPLGDLSVSVMYADPVLGATVIGPPATIHNLVLAPGRNVYVTGGDCGCESCRRWQ